MPNNSETSGKRVPIGELSKLPEFRLLAEPQQRFLSAYLTNGYDVRAAAKAAYPKARTAESVRVMGSRALHSPGVVMLLHLHYGDDPRQSFCRMVATMILSGRISKEQAGMMRLLAQVHGFVDPWSPRLERKIEPGKSSSPDAVKKRARRAARREEKEPNVAEGASLLGEFAKL